jgi:hypothetical protein
MLLMEFWTLLLLLSENTLCTTFQSTIFDCVLFWGDLLLKAGLTPKQLATDDTRQATDVA